MAETPAASQELNSVLVEKRVFPPPEDFSRRAHIRSMEDYRRLWDEADEDPEAYWGARAREELYWKEPFQTVLEWKPPAREAGSSRAAPTSPTTASTGTWRSAATRRRIVFEGEPGDRRTLTYRELHARGVPAGQRAALAGGEEGRPRRHLPADGAGGGGGDAGVRAHRRGALGGVRRLLGRGAARPDERRGREGAAHRGRRLAQGRGGAAEGERAHGALPQMPSDGEVGGVQAHRRRARWRSGRRRSAWERAVSQAVRRPASRSGWRASTRSSSSTPRARTGQAEGRAAHHGRLRDARLAHHALGVRPARGGHLLVHRRRGLGDRAQLRRLRPADERRDDGDVRGRARRTRGRTASGSIIARHKVVDLLHGAHGDPRVHAAGRRAPDASTTCRRCGCSARWASRSTPRRGCGTAT